MTRPLFAIRRIASAIELLGADQFPLQADLGITGSSARPGVRCRHGSRYPLAGRPSVRAMMEMTHMKAGEASGLPTRIDLAPEMWKSDMSEEAAGAA